MNLIKESRTKKRLSQKELADCCDVLQPCISNIENYITIPSGALIIRISSKLELCPMKLFYTYYVKDKCNICSNKCKKNIQLCYTTIEK